MTINSFKRAAAILLVMVMVLSMLPSIAFADGSDVVTINDENLRKAICEELEKSYTEGLDITEGEMASLKKLEATYLGITDLTGLGYAVNLTELNLEGNNFGNAFAGVADLANLVNLVSLNLSHCKLSDGFDGKAYYSYNSNLATNIGKMTKLEHLDLSNNDLCGYYYFYSGSNNLITADLSNNFLNVILAKYTVNGVITDVVTFDVLEEMDLSNNCFDINSLELFFEDIYEIGIDKFNFDNQKNLASVQAVWVQNYNTYTFTNTTVTRYSADYQTKTIDIGERYGTSLSFAVVGCGLNSTTTVTVNGGDAQYNVA